MGPTQDVTMATRTWEELGVPVHIGDLTSSVSDLCLQECTIQSSNA